ncbi:MAG: type II toxin-antitoxin system VapC family toxin [Saprospiraceae bacterium]|jgi:predicted nucleic acid-binding protein|uniref:type II toxin-antitoxin system VapC family toxin n=1 Tax=Candidatus Brachybacter algidus TaxID=2982024 RepID=UPI001B65B969|nr:type II toxin-antitoxin system VapC family toxin [Candidatus Brachybacter algidus]MBP7307473.1 type II toxin-antitoxin system VapC family toxin [Saprospiraceae bacterium]MBK7604688.1 type II toxin-antitoxin system VapC family toxin [Candidatus Brachybacter algidus]MBK8355135.1 type II toxin-antitoxin system VapC family toxin [Candidatus Brachybacter algidus]MBK8602404.1 type II toxin-antitoxin system VapC family toxin [Candidatus Brachybacter algidus]MBK8842257.1 type II toxin-antitoxin sys
MKIDFIADTNFLIYLHEGNKIIEPFLEYNFGVSFISELELLGFPGITISDETKLKSLLNDCFQIDWNNRIKEQTILLKRKYSIKIPDAIIAASGLVYEIPLVTADKGFTKIEELDLILIEL